MRVSPSTKALDALNSARWSSPARAASFVTTMAHATEVSASIVRSRTSERDGAGKYARSKGSRSATPVVPRVDLGLDVWVGVPACSPMDLIFAQTQADVTAERKAQGSADAGVGTLGMDVSSSALA